MRMWRNLSVALALWILIPPAAVAQSEQEPELSRKTLREVRNAVRLVDNDPTERQTLRALEIFNGILADETRTSLDRSVAFELRGRVRFDYDRDGSALVDDLILAVGEDVGWVSRGDKLVEQIWPLLIQIGRGDEVQGFLAGYGHKLFGGENAAGVLRAELLASEGLLEEALAVITPINSPEDGFLEKRLRFVILLTLGRYDEARACLETFIRDVFYSQTLEEERTFLVGFEASNPSRNERREHGLAFAAKLDELFKDAAPVERVNPRGFERCIDDYNKATERVRLQFEVSPDGTTRNVEVIETTDRCYNRASVRAVEQWIYSPAMLDGTPRLREGVQTTIVFQIG